MPKKAFAERVQLLDLGFEPTPNACAIWLAIEVKLAMRGELGGLQDAIALSEQFFSSSIFKKILTGLLSPEAQQFLADFCRA